MTQELDFLATSSFTPRFYFSIVIIIIIFFTLLVTLQAYLKTLIRKGGLLLSRTILLLRFRMPTQKTKVVVYLDPTVVTTHAECKIVGNPGV